MGAFGRLIAFLLFLGIAALIGTSIYNAGVSAGLANAGHAIASGTPVVVYPGGYIGHPWGFGFFGFFFLIFGFFLLMGLLRAVFFGGRYGHGHGYGKHGDWRSGGWRDRMDDWHNQAHGDKPSTEPPTSGQPS